MPARKSNASVMSAEDQGLSVEDLNLPKTMVNRLAKGALPANTNLQSIAQAAISKSATVFVNYLTSHASDVAARQNKKTIQPKDVLEALKEIEFEQFTERVDRELQRYNTIQCDKRNTYRRKVKEEKRAAEAAANGDPIPPSSSAAAPGDDMNAPHNPDAPNGAAAHAPPHHAHDGEPVAKRARRDSEEGEGDDTLGDEHEQEEEEEEGEDEGDEEAEDEGDEDEDENEGEGEDGEREDLLEEKEEREEQDEALDEGEESD